MLLPWERNAGQSVIIKSVSSSRVSRNSKASFGDRSISNDNVGGPRFLGKPKHSLSILKPKNRGSSNDEFVEATHEDELFAVDIFELNYNTF